MRIWEDRELPRDLIRKIDREDRNFGIALGVFAIIFCLAIAVVVVW